MPIMTLGWVKLLKRWPKLQSNLRLDILQAKLAFEIYQFQNTLAHLASPTDVSRHIGQRVLSLFLYCIFQNI